MIRYFNGLNIRYNVIKLLFFFREFSFYRHDANKLSANLCTPSLVIILSLPLSKRKTYRFAFEGVYRFVVHAIKS